MVDTRFPFCYVSQIHVFQFNLRFSGIRDLGKSPGITQTLTQSKAWVYIFCHCYALADSFLLTHLEKHSEHFTQMGTSSLRHLPHLFFFFFQLSLQPLLPCFYAFVSFLQRDTIGVIKPRVKYSESLVIPQYKHTPQFY